MRPQNAERSPRCLLRLPGHSGPHSLSKNVLDRKRARRFFIVVRIYQSRGPRFRFPEAAAPMSEIFISYKSERRLAAEHFAEVLKRYGYSVWFDYELVKGKDFTQQIERKVREAKALVVLWCSRSVSSRWVREEVYLAGKLGILIPVMIGTMRNPRSASSSPTPSTSRNGTALPRSHPARSADRCAGGPDRAALSGAGSQGADRVRGDMAALRRARAASFADGPPSCGKPLRLRVIGGPADRPTWRKSSEAAPGQNRWTKRSELSASLLETIT